MGTTEVENMASFRKMKNNQWKCEVCIAGVRVSKSFSSKTRAKSWAAEKETELRSAEIVNDNTWTYQQLFARYANQVSPKKRGCHWEQKRLWRFEKDALLSNLKLKDSARENFEKWIDHRLTQVKSSTVNRELNLLSNCLTKARVWRLMNHNPLKDLTRPKNPPPRNRRISANEIATICHAANFKEGIPLTRKSHFVAVAFLFAIETAMRASEICSLEKCSINFKTRVAQLDITKNGDERKVPLSKRAIELLKLLPKVADEKGHIFHLKPTILDANFRLTRGKTDIENLHFHDTRHEATTRMARLPNMNVLALARITGHRDLKFLMIYFNETAEELVERLDEPPIVNQVKNDGDIDISNTLNQLANAQNSEVLLGKLLKQLILTQTKST